MAAPQKRRIVWLASVGAVDQVRADPQPHRRNNMDRTTWLHSAALAGGLAAMLVAPSAFAQGYVGGGLGPSRINIDCSGLDSCDKSSTGGKVYGGFLFAPQFGAELVYFDWGKAKASGVFDVSGEVAPVVGAAEVKGDGVGVGAAWFVPFATGWDGVARLGVLRNKGKTTVSAVGLSARETFTSTEAYAGFGVGYRATPNLTVTGEMDFSRLKYTDSDKASTWLLTVGLRYKF
jgi:OmpA-OmpF porin, OOP family